MRVATDVGGTFTDLVCFDAGGIRTVKTDTTPPAFERGVLNGQFSVADGETYNIPVEIVEARYGVTVEQYAFHDEEGGEGRYRGGKGVCFDIRILSDQAVADDLRNGFITDAQVKKYYRPG